MSLRKSLQSLSIVVAVRDAADAVNEGLLIAGRLNDLVGLCTRNYSIEFSTRDCHPILQQFVTVHGIIELADL